MRSVSRGWRSARAYVETTGAGAPNVDTVATAPERLTRRGAPSVAAPDNAAFVWPWKGVKWNLAFVGFCAYSISVITYVAPIGEASMIIALVGLGFGKERVRFPAPLIFFAAYYFFALAMSPVSPWPTVVEKELPLAARVGLVFLVAINVLRERTRLRFYVFLYLAAFALYPVRGAIFNQFLYNAAELGRIAWNHIFKNPNDLAALLLAPLGLACGVVYTERHRLMRWAAIVGVALISLIVFMTQSRGGILALVCFGAWAIARQKRRLRMLPAVAGVVLLVALFAPDSVWSRLGKTGSATSSGQLKEADDFGSARQRFEIWKVAWQISLDYPITGVGLGAYPHSHWNYARSRAETFDPTAAGARDAHSSFLTALAETGFPGFIFWMGIFVSAYLAASRARRVIKHSDPAAERQIFFGQVSFIAWAVAGLFGTWNHIPFLYISVAILSGMTQVALEAHRARQATARHIARFG